MKIARVLIVVLMLAGVNGAWARRFFNLSADEVKIDSVMPTVCYTMQTTNSYQDSVYTATLLYPEFIDMSQQDIDNYKRYCGEELPELPVIKQAVITNNKVPYLQFYFSPIVYRDGKYQLLVSYALDINSQPKSLNAKAVRKTASGTSERYAANSVLASGKWAKIRVPSTGFYELTDAVIRQAGFNDLSKVHIYGYGGNLVPESLSADYLTSTDDLKPVATSMINGHRVFYAKGPVSWSGLRMSTRTRNPYSDYGYYFIVQRDSAQTTVTPEELEQEYLFSFDRHYSLYEVDNYAYFKGGRNLVDGTTIASGKKRSITLAAPANSKYTTGGTLTISVASNVASSYTVAINDSVLGSSDIALSDYDKASFSTITYKVKSFKASNTVTISCTDGGPVCLDYAMAYVKDVEDSIDLASTSIPSAEYYCNITNQNHHADSNVDMTIVIPTSQKNLAQAQRLAKHHEDFDGMTVRIVPADELYNEFSSGTPDVSAYRRYMKMMYDRAGTNDSLNPKHLLLFGDCFFDNRLLTPDCRSYSADDLLLCYESENSYNEIYCFASDDFLVMLDDDEEIYTGSNYLGTPDMGVGRFPVNTEAEAKTMVDKVINYATNSNAGSWQNTVMFMGDDGNNNMHMRDVNSVANDIINLKGFYVRKVMWDAYTRVTSSTGNRYPDIENIIKAQQNAGALVMDYAGHGAATAISGEYVLRLSDFNSFSNTNLPLWITASCDLMPFDGVEATIGEAAVLNSNGGAVAFFGTTRTVYANYNKYINDAYVLNILSPSNGKVMTLGEASQRAKTYLVTSKADRTVNKLQYSLLGDPALRLNVPTSTCVVDSINGMSVGNGVMEMPAIHANSTVTVKGHIETSGEKNTGFNGLITAVVRDNLQHLYCLDNEKTGNPFDYWDRPTILFNGTDSVRNGEFNISFAVSRDISYSDETGLITLFAHNTDNSITAHGENGKFTVGGTETVFNDSIGPSIYCYLNSPSFVNGGDVNSTPYFVAEVTDNNGINATGAGIGHDLQLVIDNSASMTYNLNDNFQFDFGTYTSGTTYYNIPTLEAGMHTLRFRAWDILNNPSTTTLSFNVVAGQTPTLFDVNATKNPAKTTTTFIVSHDRAGSNVDIEIEIFDMSGRLLHKMSKSQTSSASTATVDWDLTIDNGARLQTGVYLYRVLLSSDGSSKASKAKKLIII